MMLGSLEWRDVDFDLLTLDLGIVRYAVVSRKWTEVGGVPPALGPFLCGWFACGMLPPPYPLRHRDSFRAGWREAESIMVASR